MAELRARYESWREARERVRLARGRGLEPDEQPERIDDAYGDVTGGGALAREEGRFRLGLVQAALASELRDADARIARRSAAGASADELDELRADRVAERSAALARFGFATARKFAEALRPGVDFDYWRREAERFLANSDSRLRDAERGPGGSATLGAELPSGRLRAALDFALEGMQLELERLPMLEIDGEPRPDKLALSFAVAPRVPDDVWLVQANASGVGAASELFAAAGMALHAAFTSPALALEKRVLGDPGTPLAFGEALRALLCEPALGATLAGLTREHFAGAVRRARLTALRQTASRVATELRLAELDAGAAPGSWDEPGFLGSAGPALSSVDALRAAAFGGLFARGLRDRFGREYWKSRAPGELWKELWNTGTSYGPEELARELSLGPLGSEALLEGDVAL
ncbi:MAG TPA: hypothetical protein VMR50_10915 [Myxococcota bacterium]|nr:hypothetical protein [Myxococcota bacterium]